MTSRNVMAVETAIALGTPMACRPTVKPASATPIPPGTGISPENRATAVLMRTSWEKCAV